MTDMTAIRLETSVAVVLLEPFVEALHDCRLALEDLRDRVRAALGQHVIVDVSIFDAVAETLSGIDIEAGLLEEVADGLGGTNSAALMQIADLEHGFQCLRIAAERLGALLAGTRGGVGPVVDSEALALN